MNIGIALLILVLIPPAFLLVWPRTLERYVQTGLVALAQRTSGTAMPLVLLGVWVFLKETLVGTTLAALGFLLTRGAAHLWPWLAYGVLLCTLGGVVYNAQSEQRPRTASGWLIRIVYTVLAPVSFLWGVFAPRTLPIFWGAWYRFLSQVGS
jgi:hypothetical protein